MRLFGHDAEVAAFRSALDSGAIHHAWLLAGPRGVGKNLFATQAAQRILAQAAGPAVASPELETPAEHPVARLFAAGSHPDFRRLQREENDKGDLRRNITIAQVRKLIDFFALQPALSDWRAVVVDSVDDLEPSGANALLKMLEEPPGRSIFFLVSHSPGRLLPTIRSRCRLLNFGPLSEDAMTAALAQALPESCGGERAALVPLARGSVGRALAFAELDLAPLQADATAMMRDGDPSNLHRSRLAQALSGKAAAPRYAAFLELLPAIVADHARGTDGGRRRRALKAYEQVRDVTAFAPRHSLDPGATLFQLGTILASVAGEERGG
ncbi:DNA polymerase III subunit delta' [Sphingomonas sp. BN140010]|uniref:DNA polymerase III subunit delta n=1 Tax=Sphingomonas arvum TaxID=2992113 RepID=A0ABT3JFA7_9SPHN|nr:DNA polymerase III subunit delta' [Sphingomonas sp. BN140010]MCW3797486.1 DNA polymerase III subunit delta' [Sphingomonas sp. BN140010]